MVGIVQKAGIVIEKHYYIFGNLDYFIILFQYTAVRTPEIRLSTHPIRSRKNTAKKWAAIYA